MYVFVCALALMVWDCRRRASVCRRGAVCGVGWWVDLSCFAVFGWVAALFLGLLYGRWRRVGVALVVWVSLGEAAVSVLLKTLAVAASPPRRMKVVRSLSSPARR